MKYVNEFIAGERITDIELLVNNCTKGMTNTGAPYLNISLQDRTGPIEGKKWDALPEDSLIAEVGKVIKVTADVIDYRGAKQLKIVKIEECDQRNVDYVRFCMPSPVPQEELIRRLNSYIASIKDEDCKNIVNKIITENYNAFVTYPAASKNHHEFMSGLLYHTLSMADTAMLIASHYDNIDVDLLLSGVLLHDVGKVVELSGPVATKYTNEGRLLGHISIMASEIRRVGRELNITNEVPMLLEHMVLSHHGVRDFGSPILPSTREAVILHFVDDIDSKMNILDKAYLDVEEGEWTQRLIAMEGRAFYKAKKRR
ncbi:MAG: HD domain-containing protein [Bacillales bacterium]|nr:HD domain-containing protein [Bacillales bacterium]